MSTGVTQERPIEPVIPAGRIAQALAWARQHPRAAEATVLLLSLAVKLLLAAVLPLTDDEAYYWAWSRHLRLSYYDHPAMIALLFRLGDAVASFGGSIRWPGVILSQLTLVIWLRLLRPWLDSSQRMIFLALALLSPMIEGRGGVLVMPDLPLMFFYAVSLLLVLELRQRPSAWTALALGLAMGLGFASKYMMALLAVALLALPLVDPKSRPALRYLPLVILGGLIGSSPVWIWNVTHDFASFQFQLGTRVRKWRLNLVTPVSFAAGQALLIFPTVLFWAAKARRMPAVLHLGAWTPLAVFFALSLFVTVEGKWPSVAYLPLFALAASAFPRNRLAMWVTMSVWAAALAIVSITMIARPSFIPAKAFQTCNCRQLAAAARGFDPLYAGSYQIAAQLSYLTERPIYKLRGMTRTDEYDFLRGSIPQAPLFYVAVDKGAKLPDNAIAQGDHVVAVTPVDSQYEIWTVRAR